MKPISNLLAHLVRDLDAAGFAVALDGASIAIAPAEKLTPGLRQRISAMRPDLIELIAVHGAALLPLFRESSIPLSDDDKLLLATHASTFGRRPSGLSEAVGGQSLTGRRS